MPLSWAEAEVEGAANRCFVWWGFLPIGEARLKKDPWAGMEDVKQAEFAF